MRGLFIFFIIVFLSFGQKDLYSQSYPFREYTVMDGLPQSQSSGVFQDSRGYLWIATRNGVSRFDGTEFTNYFRKDGLNTNFVNQIFEDWDGYIYALSSHGLSRFDGQKFIYYPPSGDPNSNMFSYGTLTSEPGVIILVNNDAEEKINKLISFKDGIYSDYSGLFPALDTVNIKTILFDSRSNDLVLLDNYGNVLSWKNNLMTLISVKKMDELNIANGRIFISADTQLYEYSDGKIFPFDLKKNADKTEVIIYNFLKSKNSFSLIKNNSEFRITIPFGTSTGYLVDMEGYVWIATEKNLYRLISTAFKSFTSADGLANNIWAVSQDRNKHLWFGSLYGDLQEYDGKEFRLRNDYKTLFKENLNFYKGSRIMSDGDIYFSTNQGVLIWDGKYFSRLKGIPDMTQVCYVYEDPVDKSVLFGSNRGLYHLKDGKMKEYPEFIDNNLGVIEGAVRDHDGKYWLSGHNGLVFFDGLKFFPYRDSIAPQTFTYTIDKDSRGGLWVTSEEGLFFKAGNSDRFIHGLPESINRSANSLMMMDSSSLLIGRTTDICIIDLDKFYGNKQDYFRLYNRSDGFSGGDCLDNGIIRESDGKYLILNSNGVDILDRSKLKINIFPPKVYITQIEYKTDSLTWETLNEPGLFYNKNSDLRLSRKQNTVQISFTGISTTNPEKVNYQYRLSGYEELWSAKGPGRKAIYENLPPGYYIFQLKAFNADGIESTMPCSISFRVKPAFWQTLAYKIMVFVLIIIFSVFTTWYIMKVLQKRKKEKEKLHSELMQLQLASVIKQFDPHFTFNVLSSVGSLIMKGEKEAAYDYLLKFSSLLRTVLSDSSVITKPLAEELDFVRRYCEVQKLRFRDRFNWRVNVDENVNLQYEIPKLTIQTFVENAIKHGMENRKEGGSVIVNVKKNDSGLEINIRDNGIGRAEAKLFNSEGMGIGIKIITGLFEQTNSTNINAAKVKMIDLVDCKNDPDGTEVRIFIPDGYQFGYNGVK